MDAIGATAVQVLGNVGDVSLIGRRIKQLVDGAFGHGSTMDELNFSARVKQVDAREVAMSGGEMGKDAEVCLGIIAADFVNLTADINSTRQNAERLKLQPE